MAGNPLVAWLRSLDAERLATVLRARVDVHRPGPPRGLAELASRLADHASVAELLGLLPAPALQVIEALQLLADQVRAPDGAPATVAAALAELDPRARSRRAGHAPPVPRAELAALLGRDPGDPDLQRTLDVLADYALVWPDGAGLRVTEGLRYAFGRPLGLGRPLWSLLGVRPADELRAVAARLGRPKRRLRTEVVADLVEWLGRPENARAVAAGAPAPVRHALAEIARGAPGAAEDPAVLRWGVQHGLLAYDGWVPPEMAREVALALRGPEWHAPFTPQPPAPRLVPVEASAVRREAAAAASAALDRVAALLAGAATTPVALLKQGGVGVREVRRLARSLGASEAEVQFWLLLAVSAGMLAADEDGLLPTAGYDEWNGAEPAQRLAVLLAAWSQAPDGLGPIRTQMLAVLAGLPDGRGVVGAATLLPVVEWYGPLALESIDDPDAALARAFEQATRLGTVAHGALSLLGRALLADPHQPPLEELRPLLQRPSSTARFQADLTAVVTGTPDPALAALLDGCAGRESRGAASVWRLSPASVRRAFDAGASGEDLLGRLREAAAGPLPQPVEYLVRDVARRHGAVRARTVGCVLHSADEALLSHLVAERALRPLRLARLAPTVVVSAKPIAETLAGLRGAGYLPIGEDETGTVLVERAPERRAGPRVPHGRHGRPLPAGRRGDAAPRRGPVLAGQADTEPAPPADRDELVALAAELLAARPAPAPAVAGPGPRAGRPLLRLVTDAPDDRAHEDGADDLDLDGEDDDLDAGDDPATVIARWAPQLSGTEVRILADAVRDAAPVWIRYVSAAGSASSRVIEPLDLDGHLLAAWCQLRDDERMFALPRIREVSRA